MRRLRPSGTAILALLLAATRVGTAAGQPAPAERLVILHVNDSHGQFYPHDQGDRRDAGGVARLATLVRETRAQEGEGVLLLHAGDVISRGLPLTVHTGGEADFQVMDRLGVDALTPGNGDFYFGIDDLMGASCRVRFPLVHANVVYQATGTRLFQPYVVRGVAGVRLAILGLGEVRTDLPSGSGLALRGPVEVARELVPELRRQADLVVALTHLGFSQDSLLAASVPGIDLIVGGHSHTQLDSLAFVVCQETGLRVPIAQAGDEYLYLGRIDAALARTPQGIGIREAVGRLIPVDASVPQDSALAALLGRLEAPLREVLCTRRAAVPYRETEPGPAGQLVADAIRSVTGADVALLDRGAVRAGLDSGEVTVRQVCLVHPWRNRVLITRLSAGQIVGLVRQRRLLIAEGTTGLAGVAADSLAPWPVPADTARVLLVAAGEFALRGRPLGHEQPVAATGYRVDTALEKYLRQTGTPPGAGAGR